MGPFHLYQKIPSTQTEAKDLARLHAGEGSTVAAVTQTQGYGRKGAFWHSGPGGVWFSTVLYPKFSPDRGEAFCLHLTQAVKNYLKDSFPEIIFSVKPPNDIFAGEKKICGLLLEAGVLDGAYEWLVVGLGLNVGNDLPQNLKNTATSLKELCGKRPPSETAAPGASEGLIRPQVDCEVVRNALIKVLWDAYQAFVSGFPLSRE